MREMLPVPSQSWAPLAPEVSEPGQVHQPYGAYRRCPGYSTLRIPPKKLVPRRSETLEKEKKQNKAKKTCTFELFISDVWFFYCYCFSRVGDRTQCQRHARQALYHCATSQLSVLGFRQSNALTFMRSGCFCFMGFFLH